MSRLGRMAAQLSRNGNRSRSYQVTMDGIECMLASIQREAFTQKQSD